MPKLWTYLPGLPAVRTELISLTSPLSKDQTHQSDENKSIRWWTNNNNGNWENYILKWNLAIYREALSQGQQDCRNTEDSGKCGQIKLLKARESRQDEQQNQVQGQNISLSGDPDFWTSMDNHEGKTKTKQ